MHRTRANKARKELESRENEVLEGGTGADGTAVGDYIRRCQRVVMPKECRVSSNLRGQELLLRVGCCVAIVERHQHILVVATSGGDS